MIVDGWEFVTSDGFLVRVTEKDSSAFRLMKKFEEKRHSDDETLEFYTKAHFYSQQKSLLAATKKFYDMVLNGASSNRI